MAQRLIIGRILAAGMLVTALSGFIFLEAALAPKAEPWSRWQAHNPKSSGTISHTVWDRFLKKYLVGHKDGVNRVLYGRVSEEDKKLLHGYLNRLRTTPIGEFRRAEQKAYWINLYNALTMRLVLRFYPLDSIKDIDLSAGPFGGPWDRKLLEVRDTPLSLNDIEHRILRPIWRDPRIHYAVNCAALGCPNLQPTAFTAANTDIILDHAAQNFVNHRRGARIEDGRLTVSKIYAWFAEDFGDSEEKVIEHLRRFAEPPLAKALDGRTSIDDYEYDWALNGAE